MLHTRTASWELLLHLVFPPGPWLVLSRSPQLDIRLTSGPARWSPQTFNTTLGVPSFCAPAVGQRLLHRNPLPCSCPPSLLIRTMLSSRYWQRTAEHATDLSDRVIRARSLALAPLGRFQWSRGICEGSASVQERAATSNLRPSWAKSAKLRWENMEFKGPPSSTRAWQCWNSSEAAMSSGCARVRGHRSQTRFPTQRLRASVGVGGLSRMSGSTPWGSRTPLR